MPGKPGPEPLKSFRFLVEVEADGKKAVAAFTQFSGVKMQLETVDVRPGSEHRGVLDCVPALTSYANVKLTKGVIGDMEFLDWILAVTPGVSDAPTGKRVCRTLNIVALDDKGKRAVTWTLPDVMPVAYELGSMDGAQSAVLSETIEFTICGYKRVTHNPHIAI